MSDSEAAALFDLPFAAAPCCEYDPVVRMARDAVALWGRLARVNARNAWVRPTIGYGYFEFRKSSGEPDVFDYLKALLVVAGTSGPIEGQLLVRTEDGLWVVLHDDETGHWAHELTREDAFRWWKSGKKDRIGERDPSREDKVRFIQPDSIPDHERLPDGWLKPTSMGSVRSHDEGEVRAEGIDLQAPKNPAESTRKPEPQSKRKLPTPNETAAYTLWVEKGVPQVKVAELLQNKLGIPVSQDNISRWAHSCARKTGKPIPPRKKPPIISMDPGKLDAGRRTDGRRRTRRRAGD
jgi:hypothetical protein